MVKEEFPAGKRILLLLLLLYMKSLIYPNHAIAFMEGISWLYIMLSVWINKILHFAYLCGILFLFFFLPNKHSVIYNYIYT